MVVLGTPIIPDRCPTPAPGHLHAQASSWELWVRVPCKKWDCPRCGAIKRYQFQLRVEQVRYTKFITLTHRPAVGETRDSALARMRKDWTKLTKRLQRRNGGARIHYVAVTEWTKQGWPHLHILSDMPYIPQRHLSGMWKELHGSPIVDVRQVKGETAAAKYLAKYLTKDAHMPKKKRRYTASRGYLPKLPPYENPDFTEQPKWSYGRTPIDNVLAQARAQGYAIIEGPPGCYFIDVPPPTAPATRPLSPPHEEISAEPPPLVPPRPGAKV